ncbi:MAG: glycosyltransferase family 2 protein [Candidatus Binataceae bacterium]
MGTESQNRRRTRPFVSVVIPVYNGARTIARAIESVFAQQCDYRLEIIVANDGSTDDTPNVLARYGDRIRVLDLPNCGPAAARNAGVRASNGEFIALLDADDWWMPTFLAETISRLERDEACVLVYSDAIRVDPDANVLSTSYVPESQHRDLNLADLLRAPIHIQPSTCVLRRTAYDRVGGFCEEFEPGFNVCEDTFFFMSVCQHGKIHLVRQALGCIETPRSFAEQMVKKTLWHAGAALDRAQWTPAAYIRNYETFIRLVTARYGGQARPLIRQIRITESGLLTNAAHSLIEVGEVGAARSCYREILRIRPLDPRAYVRLAWTLLPAAIAKSILTLLPSRYARALPRPAG